MPDPENLAQRRRGAKAFSTWLWGWVGPVRWPLPFLRGGWVIRCLLSKGVAATRFDVSAFPAPLRESFPSGPGDFSWWPKVFSDGLQIRAPAGLDPAGGCVG